MARVNQGLVDAGSPYAGSSCWRRSGRVSRMRISDIAAATHIQMSTVSRQISRLLDQGLVERVDDVQVTTHGIDGSVQQRRVCVSA